MRKLHRSGAGNREHLFLLYLTRLNEKITQFREQKKVRREKIPIGWCQVGLNEEILSIWHVIHHPTLLYLKSEILNVIPISLRSLSKMR